MFQKKWPEQNFRPEAAAEDGQLACTQAYTPTSWPTNEAGLDQTNGSAANGRTYIQVLHSFSEIASAVIYSLWHLDCACRFNLIR